MGSRGVVILISFVAAQWVSGCAYNKELAPVAPAFTAAHVANQQRVMALAVDEAVEALDLSKLSGKTVSIEIAGVFPHSDEELLSYLTMQVEGKAVRAGAKIVKPGLPQVVVPGISNPVSLPEKLPTPDYRIGIAVSWAGIDNRHKVTTDEKRLTGQVGTALGGIVGGYAMQNVGESGVRSVVPGNDTAPKMLMYGGPIIAAVWALWKPPVLHTWTLVGRARIVVHGNPTGSAPAFQTEGSGASKIVIDEGSPEGYQVLRRSGLHR